MCRKERRVNRIVYIQLSFDLKKKKSNSIFQTKVRKWFLADRRQRL
jgi:hypothetical protein